MHGDVPLGYRRLRSTSEHQEAGTDHLIVGSTSLKSGGSLDLDVATLGKCIIVWDAQVAERHNVGLSVDTASYYGRLMGQHSRRLRHPGRQSPHNMGF